MGDVLASLRRHGLEENTLFMYTSDHGPQWPHGKWNLYDAGIRTRTHKYIRNLEPENKYTTHITNGTSLDGRNYWESWLDKARTDERAAWIVRNCQYRPAEELYELRVDPYELKSVADAPEQQQRLATLRPRLAAWRRSQGDPVSPSR